MAELAGKVVLVTGASRGIGEAAAHALAAAGASVMLTARSAGALRNVARQIAGAAGKIETMPCDVSDYGQCDAVAKATTQRFGPIDALINNAGVIEPIASVADADPAQWARSISINLIGAYNAIRCVLPDMIARGHGNIINVSSGAALRPLEGWSAYCSGKAGLAMLTRAIQLEHAAAGIRVFGFQPGTTDTDMQVRIRASGMNMISQIPREKLTPVALPAKGIVYLCTAAADDLSGQEISLNDPNFRARSGIGQS